MMSSITSSNPSPAELVRFEGVRKSYDGHAYVVKNLDLVVRRGEFLTMLGPSGSGKTTTLMMLGGFEVPTSGHILLDGKPVERLPPERRNIGFVFQNYALFPHLTIAENIAFPLRCRKVSEPDIRKRVADALARVRLAKFGERKPTQLSGGQQQRVALARALVFEPTLVLMDEPLGALDKQLREEMQVEIKHLQAALGLTLVYVTHDQGEALTMSDRIAVFHDGEIQQLDDPRGLYDRPANQFVARFIGENNLIPCKVDGAAAGEAALSASVGTLLRLPSTDARAGETVAVAVRPQDIRLRGSSPGAIPFIGEVRERFFLGDHERLVVSALGLPELTVRLSAKAGPALVTDQKIALEFDAADARVLTR